MVSFFCLLAGVHGSGGHGGKIRPGDARSIQAALDAAPPGSRVTIPAGVYVVREPLIVRKNDITIYAKGKSCEAWRYAASVLQAVVTCFLQVCMA
jgi:pectin methylesterase-like acyl-CoA thioesterase